MNKILIVDDDDELRGNLSDVLFEQLIKESAALQGDADDDGEVGFSDFLHVSANFGKANATRKDGDFNSDGKVGFADFLLLSANFGRKSPSQESMPLSDRRQRIHTTDDLFARRDDLSNLADDVL